MKRAITLLLLASMLTGITACGSTSDNGGQTTPADTVGTTAPETEPLTDGLPEKDMGGYEFVVYMPSHTAFAWALTYVDVEETTGDIVYDEMYDRNRRIEERFNCVISESLHDTVGVEVLVNSVLAGESEYKIAQIFDELINTANSAGALATWEKLPYVNLDAEWWNQSANECFVVNGKQYAAMGDFNLSEYSKAYMLYFNKDIYGEIDQEKSVYDMVMDGSWTIDAMITTAKQYAQDLNGDSKMDDKNDRYGYAACSKVGMSMLITGAGIKYIETDKDGNPYFAIPGNESALEKMQGIIDRFKGSENWYYNAPDAYGGMQDTNFLDGRSLFQAASIWQTDSYRSLEFDMGMLPAPKYDEKQDDYHCVVAGGVVTAIPKTLNDEDLENVSIILEALSFDSRQNLLPLYKETVLQTKYARDDESSKIIDIIFDSATYDTGILVWTSARRQYMMNEFFNLTDTLVSSTETLKNRMADEIQQTIDALAD